MATVPKRPDDNLQRLSKQPWWTEADQAELDVLLNAFIDGVYLHREKCAVCRNGGPWCDALRRGFEDVLDFRRSRAMLSKALYLRARQGFHEAAGGRAA